MCPLCPCSFTLVVIMQQLHANQSDSVVSISYFKVQNDFLRSNTRDSDRATTFLLLQDAQVHTHTLCTPVAHMPVIASTHTHTHTCHSINTTHHTSQHTCPKTPCRLQCSPTWCSANLTPAEAAWDSSRQTCTMVRTSGPSQDHGQDLVRTMVRT